MPKGDADNLRADLDDGYAKVSNLLLEALSCAPLTGSEYAVVLFIIRRTYGWAKKTDRTSGKVDSMTALEIAAGTHQSNRTVEGALLSLQKANVIFRQQVNAAGYCAYGVNPDVSEWGTKKPVWKEANVALRECRDKGTYTPTGVQVYVPERTPIRPQADTCPQSGVYPHGTNPTAAGAPEPLTDSITDKEDREARPPSTACGRKRTNGPMLLQNYCLLADAVREVYGHVWQQYKQNDFVCDAAAALDEPGCTVTEHEAVAAILGDGKPEPGRRGDWWIGDLCKVKRNGKPDPILAAFIAEHGPQKEDPTQAHIWELELTKFREQHVQPA